ncbi:MAG: type II secretion system protein GspG [bacterium]
MKKSINKKSGFTLIELLVVISVIGLLSTFTIIGFDNARIKAKIGKAQADLKQLQLAADLYYNDHNSYPCPGHWFPSWDGNPTACLSAALAPYLPKYPSDPWGNYYVWHLHLGTSECTSFLSMGPNKTYNGYGPCPPCHCEAGGDDIIKIVSTLRQ